MPAELPPLDAISLPPPKGNEAFLQVVMLHGWGANARDLTPLAEALALPHCHYWFPNAPFPHPQVPGGRMWYDLTSMEGWSTSCEKLSQWLQALTDQSGLPLRQTVLAGFSQGGALTLQVGLTLQPALAGAICMSGYLVERPRPEEMVSELPPVLMVHGTRDMVVPVEYARQSQHVLAELQVAVDYREFDMAHEISPEEVSLMRQFLARIPAYSR
jgi:phospholipase/carboxylesterase